MNYGIAFVAGAIHKLYDDIQDNEVPLKPLHLELLKVLMVTTMTIMFMRSPGVSLFFLIVIGIYYSLGTIDSDVWKACVPIPFLTCLVNYSQYGISNVLDILYRLVVVIIVGLMMYFEHGLVPEETSVRKSIIRLGFIGLAGFFLYLYRNLGAITFVGPLLWFLIGYLFTNIVYHWKTLITPPKERKASLSSVLSTETMNTEVLTKQDEALDVPEQDDARSHVSDLDNAPLKPSEAE